MSYKEGRLGCSAKGKGKLHCGLYVMCTCGSMHGIFLEGYKETVIKTTLSWKGIVGEETCISLYFFYYLIFKKPLRVCARARVHV